MQKDRMLSLLGTLPGDISFSACDTISGESVSVNADLPVQAASVIKLFIMAEAFRQREAGQFDFDAPVTVRQEDHLPSCGALSYLHAPIALPWGDLVTLMIILSDNTATNLLIDRLGIDSINETIDRCGFRHTRLRRKLWQPELSRQGIQNTVCAGDTGRFMQLLLDGALISAAASRRMLDILGDQRLNGKMPFHLHSRGIRCAHKTGEDDGITHDVGIIFAEGPVIFSFLSEHTDVPLAERALQDLALMAIE
jgi:beta-lactamase class A